ncbi:MAG: fibrobacter succinogenes major paralogous domain-containing protein [Fibromonadaceae bacterium]|jgi:uncharacterized protein (TIGR02145 family)|nr:fibrobacter succinogenes major paralogous domain-containing protein [Fibromonadaceae bacterium]
MNRIYSFATMLCFSLFFSCTEVERDNCYDKKSIFYMKCDEEDHGKVGSSCSIRDYKTVQIGNQVWMAENLNCDVAGSVCYGNNPVNCIKYGRLYNWEAARTACPSGWHLPNDDDWQTLVDFAGGDDAAGMYLKASSGWNIYEGKSGNGTNTYGFSALPGGISKSGGNFYDVGNYGSWWSANEGNSDGAYSRRMYYGNEYVNYYYDDKDDKFSVRCLQD